MLNPVTHGFALNVGRLLLLLRSISGPIWKMPRMVMMRQLEMNEPENWGPCCHFFEIQTQTSVPGRECFAYDDMTA